MQWLEPENEEGNVEYKLLLSGSNPIRYEQLVSTCTKMQCSWCTRRAGARMHNAMQSTRSAVESLLIAEYARRPVNPSKLQASSSYRTHFYAAAACNTRTHGSTPSFVLHTNLGMHPHPRPPHCHPPHNHRHRHYCWLCISGDTDEVPPGRGSWRGFLLLRWAGEAQLGQLL